MLCGISFGAWGLGAGFQVVAANVMALRLQWMRIRLWRSLLRNGVLAAAAAFMGVLFRHLFLGNGTA